MFVKMSEYYWDGYWKKPYKVPEELGLAELVDLAEQSGFSIPDMEAVFFDDCGRAPERWSFRRFEAEADRLVDVAELRFAIPGTGALLVISGDASAAELCFPQPKAAPLPELELEDVLGEATAELRERWRKRPESIRRLFRPVSFYEEVHAGSLDGLTGWDTLKNYALQEGKDASFAVARFLKERPDLRNRLRNRMIGKYYLSQPVYMLLGTEREAKDFAAREKALVEECRQQRIHLIGGSLADFWDAFDGKNYWITITEYPGSADDAATYGYVTLHCNG